MAVDLINDHKCLLLPRKNRLKFEDDSTIVTLWLPSKKFHISDMTRASEVKPILWKFEVLV